MLGTTLVVAVAHKDRRLPGVEETAAPPLQRPLPRPPNLTPGFGCTVLVDLTVSLLNACPPLS